MRLWRSLALVTVLGLAACSNEDAKLTEKAKEDPAQTAALDQAVAAYEGRDFDKAITLLRPLAEAGNAAAQNNLGRIYADGSGVVESDQEALRLFQLAAQ